MREAALAERAIDKRKAIAKIEADELLGNS